ncbi:hypothetical protein KIN20_020387 [Parelaphostrongylus tenuis]|uniref:Uncharacterized protein n=1 Tax=Parelaphostrongylus tenuis TaxID=148309 RepID=A0AAD5N359_PARTN|nr:hypothetical protein KIN20_020387 [Parelaphostrongylus tenuis]
MGCGVMPAGKRVLEASLLAASVVPVNMVYVGSSTISARVPGIAASRRTLLRDSYHSLVMHTVSFNSQI